MLSESTYEEIVFEPFTFTGRFTVRYARLEVL
jgi:hypothetical protein